MRPILEYASPELLVWDPSGKTLQDELEKVQTRAARFVTGNYNFETGSMTKILEEEDLFIRFQCDICNNKRNIARHLTGLLSVKIAKSVFMLHV